ncbi:MAG TPA: wax ester/triacylglycerol synthase domain-containing protein, partial [Amycolatopsis sp.]|uniref:wax ester/triacylglycerol synthase domain-containing protein n=1 Tax=Amycolatopsis sp. TaxID=37632 RepID=UPI002B4A5FDB
MHRRLSGLDTAFLCLDDPNMPMTMGALALFKPDHPVHPRRIAALLADRARKLPRLHESPRSTWFPPGGVAWSRCRDFAAADHVHTHCVRGRGREDRLIELVTGIMARPLDPHRPLWEIHVVAGLPGARFGLLIKLHHALTDGAGAAALVAGLLDDFAPDTVRSRPPRPAWRALTTPSGLAGLARQAVETLGVAGSVVGAARPATALATFGATPGRRRLATLRLNRDDILRIRKIHGGTTNDVVLAVLAGALRECLPDGRTVRALVPVNVRRDADGQDTGNHLSGYLCDLPVGEPDPVTRLRIVRARMDARKAAGAARGAGAVPLLAGRVPG